MGKICLILPYFGKLNSYFTLWLESCRYNPLLEWFVFTDDRTEYKYPDNVHVTYCSFADIQKRAWLIFGTDIQLDTPYDLCKFRVAYHKLFPEVVENCTYWGFCDCDLIFGDIYHAIQGALEQGYKKIHWRGHFTLFRNEHDICGLYSMDIPGNTTFRNCISRIDEKTCNLFDEVGINRTFDYLQIPIYKGLLIADLKVNSKNFYCNHYSPSEDFKNRHQIFEWREGKLYRWYVHDNSLFNEEFAYIHFLRRRMQNLLSDECPKRYLIIPPGKFIDYQRITIDFIKRSTRDGIYWQYYTERLRWKRLLNSIKTRMLQHTKLPDEYSYVIK